MPSLLHRWHGGSLENDRVRERIMASHDTARTQGCQCRPGHNVTCGCAAIRSISDVESRKRKLTDTMSASTIRSSVARGALFARWS